MSHADQLWAGRAGSSARLAEGSELRQAYLGGNEKVGLRPPGGGFAPEAGGTNRLVGALPWQKVA